LAYDHAEPVGRVDLGDQGDQHGDLVVVVVLAHLGPGLVGHAVVGVGEPMLLVLETLTPTERAVFVLREVFDLAYDEIAEAEDFVSECMAALVML